MNIRGTILAIRPREALAHEPWPAPIAALLAARQVHIETVETLHEAAAAWVLNCSQFAGILLDARALTRHEVALLQTFRRHVNLPVWLLPEGESATICHQMALAQGALAWPATADAMGVRKAVTRTLDQGSKEKLSHDQSGQFRLSANLSHPDAPVESRARIEHVEAVAFPHPPEESAAKPLLDELELRALLGAGE